MLVGRNEFISELVCPVCNFKFPIPRKKSAKRPANHIKDLWCPVCKKVMKFIENKK